MYIRDKIKEIKIQERIDKLILLHIYISKTYPNLYDKNLVKHTIAKFLPLDFYNVDVDFYNDDETYWNERFNYFNEIKEKYNLKTFWSIIEVDDMNDKHILTIKELKFSFFPPNGKIINIDEPNYTTWSENYLKKFKVGLNSSTIPNDNDVRWTWQTISKKIDTNKVITWLDLYKEIDKIIKISGDCHIYIEDILPIDNIEGCYTILCGS